VVPIPPILPDPEAVASCVDAILEVVEEKESVVVMADGGVRWNEAYEEVRSSSTRSGSM